MALIPPARWGPLLAGPKRLPFVPSVVLAPMAPVPGPGGTEGGEQRGQESDPSVPFLQFPHAMSPTHFSPRLPSFSYILF